MRNHLKNVGVGLVHAAGGKREGAGLGLRIKHDVQAAGEILQSSRGNERGDGKIDGVMGRDRDRGKLRGVRSAVRHPPERRRDRSGLVGDVADDGV